MFKTIGKTLASFPGSPPPQQGEPGNEASKTPNKVNDCHGGNEASKTPNKVNDYTKAVIVFMC